MEPSWLSRVSNGGWSRSDDDGSASAPPRAKAGGRGRGVGKPCPAAPAPAPAPYQCSQRPPGQPLGVTALVARSSLHRASKQSGACTGYLESLDDFYMMSSGLAMTQTSLGFSNPALYDLIHPESLLAWQRVRIANALARTGPEWYAHVRRHFSGTYANQYMVVDFNKFEPNRALPPDLLWVVEELPGHIPGADKTDILQFGYWPSYNVPYFPAVYAASGLAALSEAGVEAADYQMAPRAKIYRRDEGTVRDLDSLKGLLRSNGYPADPYSPSPYSAICSRGDLATKPRAGGCYDTKVLTPLEKLL